MNHRRSRLTTLLLAALALAAVRCPAAQPVYRWTTLAGRASIGSEDGSRAEARFNEPHSIAFDALGNLYIADTGNHTIRRITPSGVVSTFAGKAGEPGAVDGTGTSARFRAPQGLAVDRNGNVYVADTGNHIIRLVTPAGVVSTIAGQSGQAGTADGAVATAKFDSPDRLVVDQQGNVYLSNHGVRKISGSNVTTLSLPSQVTDVDGNTLTVLTDRCPAVDADGNLYFSTHNSSASYAAGRSRTQQYLKVLPGGVHSVVRSSYYGTDNSPNTYAWRFFDDTLFHDYAGRLFVAIEFQAMNYPRPFRVVRMLPDGTMLTNNTLDLRSHVGQPVWPLGLAWAADGKWIYTRATDSAIHSSDGVYSGTTLSPDAIDGQGTAARFQAAANLTVDRSANLWIAESVVRYNDVQVDPHLSYGTRVRKVSRSGLVSTPTQPSYWATTSSSDTWRGPAGIWVDNSDTVTLARVDWWANFTYRVNQFFPDGSITESDAPRGQANDPVSDSAGRLYALNLTNVFFSDPQPSYRRIVRREANGTWSTLAGGPSNEILDGTGTAARFGNHTTDLTLDRADNLYLIDSLIHPIGDPEPNTHYIRKITSAGVVTTIRKLNERPSGLAVGGSGTFYLTNAGSHVVTRLGADGTETLIGGSREISGSRDGTAPLFASPGRIVVDAQENLYLIDGGGTTIRKGELLGYAPEIATQPQSATVRAGGSATLSVTVTQDTTAPTYQWQFNGIAIAGATSASFTVSNLTSANAGDYTVVVTNELGSITSNKATLTVTSAPTTPSTSGGGGASSDWFAALAGSALLIRAWRRSRR